MNLTQRAQYSWLDNLALTYLSVYATNWRHLPPFVQNESNPTPSSDLPPSIVQNCVDSISQYAPAKRLNVDWAFVQSHEYVALLPSGVVTHCPPFKQACEPPGH